MNKIKYFLDQDDFFHWYLVDSSFRAEWDEWLNLDKNNKDYWIIPIFASELGGGPNKVEFYLEDE